MAPIIRGSRSGFTVAELLVCMAVFLLILEGVYLVFLSAHSAYVTGTRKQDVQYNARLALDEMIKRIRMAGYYPENYDSTFPNDIDITTNPRIHIGTSTALALFGNLDGDAVSNTSKVFLFCLDPATSTHPQRIIGKRRLTTDADLYTCSGEGDVLAENVTGLTFTYYDANNNVVAGPLDGASAADLKFVAADTVVRRSIRSIRVSLTIAEAATAGSRRQIYPLTSAAQLRNWTP